tara:strand:- start:1547 stop:1843 length:297 start_codon:yes stop_codon:yes gene_type:complete
MKNTDFTNKKKEVADIYILIDEIIVEAQARFYPTKDLDDVYTKFLNNGVKDCEEKIAKTNDLEWIAELELNKKFSELWIKRAKNKQRMATIKYFANNK